MQMSRKIKPPSLIVRHKIIYIIINIQKSRLLTQYCHASLNYFTVLSFIFYSQKFIYISKILASY